MKPVPIQIDPKAVKAQVKAKAQISPQVSFGDVMDGVFAMGPATAELVGQWSGGSDMAGAVLNAAFSGVNVTGGMAAGGAAGAYGPYSSYPGMMGTPRYTTQTGFAKAAPYSGSPSMNADVADPSQYSREIMETMSQNNLKLLELQALMQSNMQSWTTKSNILSADHRARMSMIEKFTARA